MKHSRRMTLACASAAALASLWSGPLAGASAHTSTASSGQAQAASASASAHQQRASAHKPAASGTPVSIRIEGMKRTLLAETTLKVKARSIDPDGKPADTCEGDTAAAALQLATKGKWTAGAYYSGLGYSVAGLFGESYPFTSDYYWSFWVDGKVATTGICGATLHPGEKLLFFPQCSKESAAECPDGLFDPPVLQIGAPKHARADSTITVTVSSLNNLTGKAAPGAGVKLKLGKRTVTTNAAGKARLRLAKAGKAQIFATATGAIRDEFTVSVRR